MSKIEKELTGVTGIKPGKNRQDYLSKTHKAVMDLADDKWDGLSEGAQKWANSVTKAIEAKEDLPDFPDAETKGDAKEKAPAKASTARSKPKAEAADEGEQEPEAKAAPKGKAPVAEKKPAVKKGPGKIDQLKVVILKNLSAKPEDLKAKVKAADIEVSDSTVTTVRSDFLSSLRVLKKADKLDEAFAEKLGDI